jgi:hypothetical protein
MARKSRILARRIGKDSLIASHRIYRVLVELGPRETLRDLSTLKLDYGCMPQLRDDVDGKRKLHA